MFFRNKNTCETPVNSVFLILTEHNAKQTWYSFKICVFLGLISNISQIRFVLHGRFLRCGKNMLYLLGLLCTMIFRELQT